MTNSAPRRETVFHLLHPPDFSDVRRAGMEAANGL